MNISLPLGKQATLLNMRFALMLLVGVCCAVQLSPAHAQPAGSGVVAGKYQSASVDFGSNEPGKSSSIEAKVNFLPSNGEGTRPFSVLAVGIKLPPGTRVDWTSKPKCTASDWELTVKGPDICAASKVGEATAKVDFCCKGSERLGAPYQEFFLGDGELVSYEHNQLGIPGKEGFTIFPLIFRAKLTDEGFTVGIPEGPSLSPPDGLWALKSVNLKLDPGLFLNPPSCDAKGSWTLKTDFRYYIGHTESLDLKIPCTQPVQVTAKPKKKKSCKSTRSKRNKVNAAGKAIKVKRCKAK